MKKLVSKIQKMNVTEIIIYLVIIVALIWILRKSTQKIKNAIRKAKYDIFGAQTQDGSTVDDISETKKAKLDQLAYELHDDIYAWLGTAEDTLAKCNLLNDNEFIYMYESYARQFQQNAYYDVDYEFLPETDEDEKFMQRAKDLGLPINNMAD